VKWFQTHEPEAMEEENEEDLQKGAKKRLTVVNRG
jgi:hypothetical protein